MNSVSITLDGRTVTAECPLGTTLREFLLAQLDSAPEVVSLPDGAALSPELTLVHRCDGEIFSTEVVTSQAVAALVPDQLLTVGPRS